MYSGVTIAQGPWNALFVKGRFQYPKPNVKTGCSCGTTPFDCICGLSNIRFKPDPHIILHKDTWIVDVSDIAVVGTEIHVGLRSKPDFKLSSNIIDQTQEIALDKKSANELGYEAIIILPGRYGISDEMRIAFKAKLGKKIIKK